jgi:hypothetical protein
MKNEEAVYINKDANGVESICCNSRLMTFGKLYEIEWQGNRWALRKTDKGVEFLEWVLEED